MLLSTLVVTMVASTFLVQNEFYSDAVRRSALHEGVRGSAFLVSAQLQGVARGGIVAAESDSVSFRMPLALGGVCAVSGSETYLFFPRDGEEIDGAEVAGYAVRDAAGDWVYTDAEWEAVFGDSGSAAAAACVTGGADTTGAATDFYRLDGLTASPVLQVGDLVMIYQQRTLKLAISTLDSISTALFTGTGGGTLTEFASSLTPSSGFQYRLSHQAHWRNRVAGGNLRRIAVVRFLARGAMAPTTGGRDSLTFNLDVSVHLQNAN
jgi:hypothetical protein